MMVNIIVSFASLLILVLIFIVLWLWASKRGKKFKEKILEQSCSDQEFIIGCGYLPGSEEALMALQIRKMFADLARVSPCKISPTMRFSVEMMFLDFWGEFDSNIFASTLCKEFHIQDASIFLPIIHPYSLKKNNYTVKDMIAQIESIIILHDAKVSRIGVCPESGSVQGC